MDVTLLDINSTDINSTDVNSTDINSTDINSADMPLTTVALLGITAAICCFICLLVLVALLVHAKCYSRSTVCGTTIKRLTVGLIVPTMLYLFVLALRLVQYFYQEMNDFCEFQGFLVKYFASIQLLQVLGVCLILFLEVLKQTTSCKLEYYEKVKRSTFTCCGRKINKLEIVIFALAFTIPLFFDWIPFTTNSYGPNSIDFVPSRTGVYCWFRDQNCSTHNCTAELWEEIWLSTVPFGLIIALILLLFTVSMCLLGYKIKKAKAGRKALIEVGVTNLILFIVVLVITNVLLPNKIPVNIQIGSYTMNFAVITLPLIVMLVPLTLLMAVHLPLSSMILRICLKCRQRSHTSGECDQTTVHESSDSQQPSHTTWTPPHSCSDLEPFELTPFVRYEQ